MATEKEAGDDKTRLVEPKKEPMIALQAGARLQEYEIKATLGIGGFGITYLAEDTNLNKPVAVKEYFPSHLAYRDADLTVHPRTQLGSDPELYQWGLDRVIQEARVLAQFDHPNIIRVARYFEANGTAYIVMDFAAGDSLSAVIKAKGRLEEAEFKPMFDKLLAGLKGVHSGDILHRDIKPANIIIKDNGEPVLIDFGAARQTIGNRATAATAFHSAGFTPIEQLGTAGKLGPWTDIYSLAATAYNALVGKPPTDCNDRILHDNYQPAVVAVEGRASPALLASIDWALSVRAEDRPQTIEQWLDAIEGKVDIKQISQAKNLSASVKPADPSAATKLSTPHQRHPADQPHHASAGANKSNLMIIASLVLVLLLGSAGVFYFSGADPNSGTDPAVQPVVENTSKNGIEEISPTVVTTTEQPIVAGPPLETSTETLADVQVKTVDISDEQDFRAAKYIDTNAAYTLYLRLHPNGEFVQQARSAMVP